MTQQNAALVEQSAAAAESLRDQAVKLAQVVQVFRLDHHPKPVVTAAKAPGLAAQTAAPAPLSPARVSVNVQRSLVAGHLKPEKPERPSDEGHGRTDRPKAPAAEGEWENF
jgi:methyl-accepting chemotaxis protein